MARFEVSTDEFNGVEDLFVVQDDGPVFRCTAPIGEIRAWCKSNGIATGSADEEDDEWSHGRYIIDPRNEDEAFLLKMRWC